MNETRYARRRAPLHIMGTRETRGGTAESQF